MGKSQDTPQFAVGMNGMRGIGGGSPHFGFFLGRTLQLAAGFFTSIRSFQEMKDFLNSVQLLLEK